MLAKTLVGQTISAIEAIVRRIRHGKTKCCMSRRKTNATTVKSWTNGQLAVTSLKDDGEGGRWIEKKYRTTIKAILTMIREYMMMGYISRRLSIVPRLLGVNWKERELRLTFIPGTRVLEWVLGHCGREGLDLAQFESFHGLQTNPDVAAAFANFRSSPSVDCIALKEAILSSYRQFHRTGMVHGCADPRNLIYCDGVVHIIDFDHARPSFARRSIDGRCLKEWYGIDCLSFTPENSRSPRTNE
jgi:hypothetical protein